VQVAYEDALAYLPMAGKKIAPQRQNGKKPQGEISRKVSIFGVMTISFYPKWQTGKESFPVNNSKADGWTARESKILILQWFWELYDMAGNVGNGQVDWYIPIIIMKLNALNGPAGNHSRSYKSL